MYCPPVSAVVMVSREASGARVVAGGAVVGRVRSRCTGAGAGSRLNAWDIPCSRVMVREVSQVR